MIPVLQSKDNCMAACWASILEIPLEEVPDYQAIRRAGGSWLNAVNTWLSKHHGQIYVELERHLTPYVVPAGYHLYNVGVPDDGDGGHAIVAFCGRPIWDPRGRSLVDVARVPVPDSYGFLVDLTDELKAFWRPTWKECLCPGCLRSGSGLFASRELFG